MTKLEAIIILIYMTTRKSIAQKIISLAQIHKGKGKMIGSSELCVSDAERTLESDPENAARRALSSLSYSVGIFHADYISARNMIEGMKFLP